MPSGGATSDNRSQPPNEAAVRRAGEGGAGEGGAGLDGRVAAGARADRARAGRPGPGVVVPVAVTWDERRRRPVAFVWRRRTYRVERVLETWIVETGWWNDDGHVSRSYWCVRAGGRVVDLRYDRLDKAWVLEREVA